MFVRGKPELFKGIVRRDPRKDNNHGARGLSPKRGSSNGGNTNNNNSRNTANGNGNHGARIIASTSRMMRPPPPPPVPLPPPFAPIMMPAVDVALRRLEAHHARAPSVDLEMLIMEAKMHQNNTALLAEEGDLHAPTPPPSRHHHQQRHHHHHHHAREPSIDVEMFLLEAAKMTTTTTTMSTRPSSSLSLSSSSAANNQPRRRPQTHARDPSLDLHASEIETFYEFFYPQDPIEKSLINSAVFNNNNNNNIMNTNNDYDNDTLDSVSSGAQEGEEEEQLFSTMLSLCDDDLNGFVTMLSNDHDAAGTSSHEEYPDEGEEYGEHYQPEEEPSSLSLSSFPSPAAVLVGANKKRQEASAPAPPLGRAATTDDADHAHADDEDLECSDLGFPSKLHLMLENAERDNYVHIVSWVKDGTAFKVHNHKEFVHRVMPVYFDQSMYESFRRQLNLYHFSRCSRGQDRGVISHPLLRAGARHLCSGIKRGKVVVVNDAPGSLLPPSAMVLSEGESVRRMSL